MAWFFELAYLVGFTPWDREDSPVTARLQRLVDGPDGPPPGRGIDLGCGRGQHTVFLARHGWTMTGVDVVERALRTARERAEAAKVKIVFVRGDVTRLEQSGIAGPFDLFLDSGCFHGLPDDARSRYSESVTRVAAHDARFFMFAFGRSGFRFGPRGAERADVERALSPAWRI